MEKASIVYDMYASDTNTGSTININLENLSLANQLALSEEAYVKVATAGVQGALESAGFTDVSCEPATFTLAGREHAGMKVTAMAQNIPVYEAIVCIKTGGYMANLTVCTFGEDQTQALLDKFYAVN